MALDIFPGSSWMRDYHGEVRIDFVISVSRINYQRSNSCRSQDLVVYSVIWKRDARLVLPTSTFVQKFTQVGEPSTWAYANRDWVRL